MENVFIFIVFRVFTANTNMERRPGDWSVHETRGKRELVFRNYWSQYGHNNATQLSAWPMGSTNHLSSLKSTIIDWKELISELFWTAESIRTSDIEPQSRICVPSLGWQNYNFVLNFVQIVIVQISLQSAGGPGHRVLATQGAERLW